MTLGPLEKLAEYGLESKKLAKEGTSKPYYNIREGPQKT